MGSLINYKKNGSYNNKLIEKNVIIKSIKLKKEIQKYGGKNKKSMICSHKNSLQSKTVKTYLLTDKFKPRTSKGLLGNGSIINSLRNWLRDWDSLNLMSGSLKSKDKENVKNKKAVLISGPPGIGKTTRLILLAENSDLILSN